MFQTLSQLVDELPYKSNKCKFNNILHEAQKMKLNSVELDTNIHKKCNILKDSIFCNNMKDDLIILQVPISLNNILPRKRGNIINNNKLKEIECGRFDSSCGKYVFNNEYLSENIKYCISMKKKIFIMFIFKEYCVVEGKDKKGKCLEYSTHSTCMFIKPSNINNNYEAFYINSHGRDLKDAIIFKRIVSRSRTYNVKYDIPFELLLIENLVEFWNNEGGWYKEDINIYWDDSDKYTYYDSNLQSGDNYGVCFAYPQIIFHHIGEYYNKSQKIFTDWGEITINSGETLINCGKISLFIKSAFINYSSKYKNKFIQTILSEKYFDEYDNDILEVALMEDNTKFIKKMLFYLTRYMKEVNIKI